MRRAYRFYVCPEGGCPKVGAKGGRCPDHDKQFLGVILDLRKSSLPGARQGVLADWDRVFNRLTGNP